MGRRRSTYICPVCKHQGRHPRKKKRGKFGEYWYVEHYDPVTKRTSKTCYVDKYIREEKQKEIDAYISTSNYPKFTRELYKSEDYTNKLIKILEQIHATIRKHNITSEDDRLLAGMMIQEMHKFQMLMNSISLYQQLLMKPETDRTRSDEKFLEQMDKVMNYLKEKGQNANIMYELFKARKVIDLSDPEIKKLIKENLSGAREFSSIMPLMRPIRIFYDKYVIPERRKKIAERIKKRNLTREQKGKQEKRS